VEEKNQYQCRMIEAPKVAAVVWVENSTVQEGKRSVSYFET